jgi:hypothetical protein
MEIALTKSLSTEDKLCEIDLKGYVDLPAEKIIIFDTNIVFSSIFPRKVRKCVNLMKTKNNERDVRGSKRSLYQKNSRDEEKRIRVVNALEDGEFKRLGLYPGITNAVYGDLKHFERVFQTRNLDEWIKSVSDKVYRVFVSVEDLRNHNRVLSDTFPENSDFSVAVASYLLGSDFATDDYDSFCNASVNRLNKEYFDRWGSKKKLSRYDTDSLLMKLSKS